MLVWPMHTLATRPGWDELTSRKLHGFPDAAPPPRPLPSVGDVLAAFAGIGAHGDAEFMVEGVDPALPPCSDPWTCSIEGWADLGQVSLGSGDESSERRPLLTIDSPVAFLHFRKPHGRVVLQALCQLAPVSGTLVAHDDQCDYFVAVHPGQRPDDFGPAWWWA
jgi:hypothetical protein